MATFQVIRKNKIENFTKTMTTEKEKIFIAIDTEFEHECVITGNCLQLAFVAFRENIGYMGK